VHVARHGGWITWIEGSEEPTRAHRAGVAELQGTGRALGQDPLPARWKEWRRACPLACPRMPRWAQRPAPAGVSAAGKNELGGAGVLARHAANRAEIKGASSDVVYLLHRCVKNQAWWWSCWGILNIKSEMKVNQINSFLLYLVFLFLLDTC
jgi:hypothetical protein